MNVAEIKAKYTGDAASSTALTPMEKYDVQDFDNSVKKCEMHLKRLQAKLKFFKSIKDVKTKVSQLSGINNLKRDLEQLANYTAY